jgi:uroporphyrinogen decarboxylase
MHKRERLEAVLGGGRPDRVPVTLWRHWPGDDQRSADFARYTVGFQRAYDWDIVKVTPFSAYCVADYDTTTAWQGDLSGDRHITRRPIKTSINWTELRPLDPMRGELSKHLEGLRLIFDAMGDNDTPVITTIYSPLTQALMLGGADQTCYHLRTMPDRLHSGLNTLTESTLRLLDALRRLPLAGIFYVMDAADYTALSHAEYAVFGQPYDQKVLQDMTNKWWLNVASVGSDAPMFPMAMATGFPIIHWNTRTPSLVDARSLSEAVFCGGLDHQAHLHIEAPTAARDAIRTAFVDTDRRRFILSTDAATFVSTPRSNLRAVREAVEA